MPMMVPVSVTSGISGTPLEGFIVMDKLVVR